MQVKINQEDISFALNIVGKAINPNNTLPILNNILLEAKNGKLEFSATNLEIAIKYACKAKIETEGALTVPAKLVLSYIGLLPNEELKLSQTDDLSLEIESNKSDTKIKSLKADDYPSIPKVESETFFEVNAKSLEKAILETFFAASLNTSRPILSGIFMKVEGEELIMVATDSYRLAESKISLGKDAGTTIECIIPSKTMLELARILNSFDKETVKIYHDKNKILFAVNEVEMTSRLIEGSFPDYKKIIPTETKTQVVISAADLSLALKRISLFAKEVNNSIHLDIDKEAKKLTVSTEETKLGEEKTKLDIEINGENNKISLNSQYLLDVLSVKEGERVILEVNEKLSPVKVRPEKNPNYTYIIMPLKV